MKRKLKINKFVALGLSATLTVSSTLQVNANVIAIENVDLNLGVEGISEEGITSEITETLENTSEMIETIITEKSTTEELAIIEELEDTIENDETKLENLKRCFEYEEIDNKITIKSIKAGVTVVEIPIFEGKTVTLASGLFKGNTTLTSVTINGDLKIEDNAFQNCSSLKTLKMPDVTNIGASVFSGCSSLEELDLSSLSTASPSTFTGAESVKKLILGLETLGISNLFQGLTSLEELEMPNLTSITAEGRVPQYSGTGSTTMCSVFWNQPYLYTDKTTNSTFMNSTIKMIKLPKLTTIDNSYTFAYLKWLEEVVMPELTSITGNYTFEKCSSLRRINLPNLTEIVGERVFGDCSSLEKIESTDLPKLEKLGSDAFKDCAGLKSVKLPSLTTVGIRVFLNCSSLEIVELPSLVTIGQGMFNTCSNLTSAILPKVITAGDYVFYGCSSLEELDLSSLRDVSEETFTGAEGVKELKLGLETLDISSFFQGLTSLEELEMPNLTSITGDYSFSGCSSLRHVVIPELTSITGSYTFYDCSSLQNLCFPKLDKLGGSSNFVGCTSLNSVVFKGSTNIVNAINFSDNTTVYINSRRASTDTYDFGAGEVIFINDLDDKGYSKWPDYVEGEPCSCCSMVNCECLKPSEFAVTFEYDVDNDKIFTVFTGEDYILEQDEIESQVEQDYGTYFDSSGKPLDVDGKFTGVWVYKNATDTVFEIGTKVNSKVVLTPKWTNYKVSFKPFGEYDEKTIEVTGVKGERISVDMLIQEMAADEEIQLDLNNKPIKDGYEFIGYYYRDSSNQEKEYTGNETSLDSSIVIYGKWKQLFTVTFKYDEKTEFTITANTENIINLDEMQEDYKKYFDGYGNPKYDENGTFTGTWLLGDGEVFEVGQPLNANFSVEAKWTYEVEFKPYGENDTTVIKISGNKGDQKSIADLHALIQLDSDNKQPIKDGYKFIGYYYKESNGEEQAYNGDVELNNNIVVYGKWAECYTITFKYDENTEFTITANTDDVVGVDEIKTNLGNKYSTYFDGYGNPKYDENGTFTGTWLLGDGEVFEVGQPLNANVSVEAKWTYEVEFKPYGENDTTVIKISGNKGDQKSIADLHALMQLDSDNKQPIKDGYKFIGYYYKESNGEEQAYNGDVELNNNIVIYGKWAECYKATFKYDGNTTFEITANKNDIVGLEEIQAKLDDEYDTYFDENGNPKDAQDKFTGTWVDENTEKPFVIGQPLNANVSVEAKWTYEVEFKPYGEDDATVIKISGNKGDQKSIADLHALMQLDSDNKQPIKDGYKFIGYYYKESNGEEQAYNGDVELNNNIVIYGKWAECYTVTFKYDGNTTFEITANTDDVVGVDEIKANLGNKYSTYFDENGNPKYDENGTFTGTWLLGDGEVFEVGQPLNANVSVEAKWTYDFTIKPYSSDFGYYGENFNNISIEFKDVAKGTAISTSEINKKLEPFKIEIDEDGELLIEGFKFKGYFYKNNAGKEVEHKFEKTTDLYNGVVVYGKWERYFNATFKYDEEKSVEVSAVKNHIIEVEDIQAKLDNDEYNIYFDENGNPKDAQDKFTGTWVDEKTGEVFEVGQTILKDNVNLSYKWTYRITVMPYGKDDISIEIDNIEKDTEISKELMVNAGINLDGNGNVIPKEENLVFKGFYYIDEDGEEIKYDFESPLALYNGVVIYGKWSEPNNSTLSDDASATVLSINTSKWSEPNNSTLSDGGSSALLLTNTLKSEDTENNSGNLFVDVNEGHWAKYYIEQLAKLGILNGLGDGTFNPMGNTKRADVAVMIVGLLGIDVDNVEFSSNFEDVVASKYYSKYVGVVKEYGIVKGYKDNTFKPENNITRQETMIIIANVLKMLGIETDSSTSSLSRYNDSNDISEYAKESVAILVNLGLIVGDTEGNINPKAEITRAEMSVVIYKFYNLLRAKFGNL